MSLRAERPRARLVRRTVLAVVRRPALAALCVIALAGLCREAHAAADGVSSADSTSDGVSSGRAVPVERIEARSADLLAVGIVRDDRMTIHLSRLEDNAPVRDAVLDVRLRGVSHATSVEADGSYVLRTPDLRLPGSATVEFHVTGPGPRSGAEAGSAAGAATGEERFRGELKGAAIDAPAEDKNGARQGWWWVLNFAVCIGFLMLMARRRKAAAREEAAREVADGD